MALSLRPRPRFVSGEGGKTFLPRNVNQSGAEGGGERDGGVEGTVGGNEDDRDKQLDRKKVDKNFRKVI